MSFRFSPGRCCCDLCYQDNFVGSTVGSNWDVISGDWTVSGNVLYTSSSDAIIKFVHPLLGTIADPWASVGVAGGGADEVRLMLSYQDPDNHYSIRGTPTTGGNQLVSRSGGVDAPIDDCFSVHSLGRISLALSTIGMIVGSSQLNCHSGKCGYTAFADGVALGTGTVSGSVSFSLFQFGSLRDLKCVSPDCPNAFDDVDEIPCQRKVTISGYAGTGCCHPDLDGEYVLDWDADSIGTWGCGWKKDVSVDSCTGTLHLSFLHTANGGYSLHFEISGGDPNWQLSPPTDFYAGDTYELTFASGGLGLDCHEGVTIEVGPA